MKTFPIFITILGFLLSRALPSQGGVSTNGVYERIEGGTDEPYAISTFAGLAGVTGSDDGSGSAARFNFPTGTGVDNAGNVYIADASNQTIRKISSGGMVTTLAGLAGNHGSADGDGSAARFYQPSGVAVDSAGNVYVADTYNDTIRKITPDGIVTTLAGLAGVTGHTDGAGSVARFYNPSGVAVGGASNVYVSDYANHTIRKITSDGVVSTLAGLAGASGSDDGTGSAARFNLPFSVAVDNAGDVYVADSGNSTIRKITSSGAVSTIAGLAGAIGSTDGTGSDARFHNATGIAADTEDNLYIADYGNHTIRKILSNGVVSTLAGLAGANGSDDGTGTAARFYFPAGLAADSVGSVYIADTYNDTIRLGNPTALPPSPLSLHSVSPTAPSSVIIAYPSDNIDAPLPLRPDEAALKNQPVVSSGLVADGVMPLLIEFDPTPVPQQDTTYTFSMNVSGGSLTTGSLIDKLLVLQRTGGISQFVAGSSVTVSTSHPTGFAYISGIKSEGVVFDTGSKELSVTLSITKNGDSTPTATSSFRIRKPPVVLIHGYNSDNGAWYTDETLTTPNAFVNSLQATYPSDFVIPIEYGVGRSGTTTDDTENTSGAFVELAPLLDAQLIAHIEGEDNLLRAAWAYTRYDIVGHSQGGVLARMLCTDRQPSSFSSFRSQSNAWRGRFHRVVTLNSPHNGSTLLRYLLDMQAQGKLIPEIIDLFGNLIQPKFDPWGFEIPEINGGNWHVDPAAKFHLVGTEIDNGTTKIKFPFSPLCYSQTGIAAIAPGQHVTRGKVVIPLGSDGVVDYSSQFGGAAMGDLQGTNTSHSSPNWVFGVATGDTVTANAALGNHVSSLLIGPETSFGPFVLRPIDPLMKDNIDAVVPPVNVNGSLIQLLSFDHSPAHRLANSNPSVYQFTISPAQDQQPVGPPSWYCEVTGPSGVTISGVTVTPDRVNPNNVSVSIDNRVVGDVVLHVSYNDVNGNVIIGTPVLVASQPPNGTLTALEFVPDNVSLNVGSSAATKIWGDYDSGVRSQLYVPSDADISYTSEDPTIATIDGTGNVRMIAVGTTNIDVSYLGFTAQASVTVSPVPPPPVLAPLGAVSRKIHKSAGTFDITLPLTGDEGIECRSAGRGGKYEMVVTFAGPVTVASVSVTSGTGTVSSFRISGTQVTIDFSGAANAQRLIVTLAGVSDGSSTNDISIPMAVLVADITGDGIVDDNDLTEARSIVGQAANMTNFRIDVNVSGQIDKSDTRTIKSNTGTHLPP